MALSRVLAWLWVSDSCCVSIRGSKTGGGDGGYGVEFGKFSGSKTAVAGARFEKKCGTTLSGFDGQSGPRGIVQGFPVGGEEGRKKGEGRRKKEEGRSVGFLGKSDGITEAKARSRRKVSVILSCLFIQVAVPE